MEQQQVKYKGVPVFMDGKEYIVPALSVRQFQENSAVLFKDFGEMTPETFGQKVQEIVPVIGMAIRRNYPDVSDGQLLDMLDMGTIQLAIQAIAAASGMKRVLPGENQPAAEK